MGRILRGRGQRVGRPSGASGLARDHPAPHTPHPTPRTPTATGERWSEGTPSGGDGGQYAGRAARGWQTTQQGRAVGRLQGAVIMAEARGKQQTVQPGGSGMMPATHCSAHTSS
jgi:hypothetical protein